jgi:hypothetical protein
MGHGSSPQLLSDTSRRFSRVFPGLRDERRVGWRTRACLGARFVEKGAGCVGIGEKGVEWR